jgi:hypothetical protein
MGHVERPPLGVVIVRRFGARRVATIESPIRIEVALPIGRCRTIGSSTRRRILLSVATRDTKDEQSGSKQDPRRSSIRSHLSPPNLWLRDLEAAMKSEKWMAPTAVPKAV